MELRENGMAVRTPQRFLNFAADNYPLLRALLDVRSIHWDRLHRLVVRHRRPADPEPDTIRENLVSLGFLERQPEGDALEIPQPIVRFFRFLNREHHLTSAGQIRAYVDEIGRLEKELDGDAARRPEHLGLVLTELTERIEQIRHDIAGNREAITDAVIRFQSNREERPLRDVYEHVIWLWERYVVPIQDLIDPDQIMEGQWNRLESTLRDRERSLHIERPDLAGRLREIRLRLQRARRQVSGDFREAMLELQPIYRRALRESETAQAVSRVLDRVRSHGLNSLALDEYLGTPVLRHEGLFSDLAVKSYLLQLVDYDPQTEVELDETVEGDDSATHGRIDLPALMDAMTSEQPADAMGWLAERIEAQSGSIRDLLMGYGRAVRRLPIQESGGEMVEYRFGPYRIKACPHAVVGVSKETSE